MKRLILITLLSVPLWAANYNVKAGGGGDYTTITACNAAMVAGDSCTVFAGDYRSEGTITMTDGTAGNYKTLQVNGSDDVLVTKFITGSHDKVIGFDIKPSSPSVDWCVEVGNSSTDTFIKSNTMTACAGIRNHTAAGTATYIYIQNNTLSYSCSSASDKNVCGPFVSLKGDHWLVEGNNISHTRDFMDLSGSNHVIRNNKLHDAIGRDPLNLFGGLGLTPECIPLVSNGANFNIDVSGNISVTNTSTSFGDEYPGSWVTISAVKYTVASVTDSKHINISGWTGGTQSGITVTGGNGGNCHIDGVQSEPNTTSQNNLIENNTLYNNLGSDSHGFLAQGDKCAGNCSGLIIRFNQVAHFGRGILNDFGGFTGVKDYNNTWADMAGYAPNVSGNGGGLFSQVNDYTASSTNAANKNDIFYLAQGMQNYSPYRDDSTTDATFASANNLAWCVGQSGYGSNCYLHNRNTSGCFSPFNACASAAFTVDPGNLIADPLFTSYSSSSIGTLTLALGSSAIAGGVPLTTVSGGCGGSTTSITVGDAGYFSAGNGMTGVSGDVIRVGNLLASPFATITSISSNTINFTPAISCSNGDGVFIRNLSDGTLVLFGASPNIGSQPAAQSPSVVTIHCLGTGTSTAGGLTLTDGVTATSATCNTGAATCTSGTPDGTGSGCTNNYANNTSLTVTATAAGGSIMAGLSGGGCLTSPCTVNTGTGNLDIYGTFDLTPSITLASNASSCNVVQGCSLTLTVVGGNLNTTNLGWKLTDASGAVITDTSTGKAASCVYGVNDFCSGTPTGTFTVHWTISNAALAQNTATASVVGTVVSSNSSVTIGMYGGRQAGPIFH